MAIPKEERLLNLFYLLLHSLRPVSHKEIHEKVEGYRGLKDDASRRQFERDKVDLTTMGIPISKKDVFGTALPGYFIDKKNYYLTDIELNKEERTALNLLSGIFRLGEKSFDEAMLKLGGIEPRRKESNPFEMIWIDYEGKLPEIHTAISKEQVMTFEYRAETGELTTRQLEPAHFYLLDGHWHVRGYDQTKKAIRSFRISRIQGGISVSESNSFTTTPDKNFHPLQPWEYGAQDVGPNKAELLIDGDNVKWVASQIPNADIEEREDSAVFGFDVTSPLGLYRFVADLYESAEILGDAELRAGFISYLEELT